MAEIPHEPARPGVSALLLLALAPAVGLGIGRFAYGLLLPDMRDSLHWTYAQAGLMNTANAAGYFGGALIAPWANVRLAPRSAVLAGAVIVAASLLLGGATGAFLPLALVRFAAGFGAAVAFVAGGAMAVEFSRSGGARGSFLLGIFYAGPGFGILVSGLLVPVLAGAWGPGSWWEVWLALGALSVAMTTLLLLVPSVPAPHGAVAGRTRFPTARSVPVLAAYFLFGAGYIAYMTFMVAWVREIGGGTVMQAAFWCLIGLGALGSPVAWSWIIARFAGGRAVGLLTGLTAAGALLPLALGGAAGLFASALLFGSAFFAVVAATTAYVRRYSPPGAVASGIAVMTVVFSAGQTLGPFFTGAIIDGLGSVSSGLWVSVAVLALGAATAFLQRDLAPAPG